MKISKRVFFVRILFANKIGLSLLSFFLVVMLAVASIFLLTKERIRENIKTYQDNMVLQATLCKNPIIARKEKGRIIKTTNIELEEEIYISSMGLPCDIVTVWHTRFGYGGSIDFAISFSEDAKNIVKKIVVLRHSETPGMGDKITIKKTNWITQFFNKTQELVRENIKNKKFDTITGATISSNGFAKAINKSLELWFAKEHNLKPNNDFAK